MADSVPDQPQFVQVAVVARIRAFSATPPAPRDREPPFGHALPNWLSAVTLLGADVLHTNLTVLLLTAAAWTRVEPPTRMTTEDNAAGRRVRVSRATAKAYRPTRHPSQAPRNEQRLREARIAEAWRRVHALSLALRDIGIGPRSTERGSLALAETALWLAGAVTRHPGVPIYGDLALPGPARDLRAGNLLTGDRWGRNGRNIVCIECAAAHDLAAAPFAQLSRVQGWRDHEDHAGRPAGASSAKRAVREGRLLLHRLGAWPWAHVERGRLHERDAWWCDPEVLMPLRLWIAQSWGRLLITEFCRHARAVDLEPHDGVIGQAAQWSW
jgi:hypothetical protein